MSARTRRTCLVATAFALLAGCGGKDPAAPKAVLPPEVTAVFPPARSSHVVFDTAIWAEFKTPLDPATVNVKNVYLKVDTQRLPITVGWDAATRRIVIRPTQLRLLRTHTVELSPRVATADGTPLGATYFWQFTTSGVRLPTAPFPANDAGGESPYVTLTWTGTESAAGAIAYDVRVGADSAAIAALETPPVLTTSAAAYLPRARWPQTGPIYWSVFTLNATSGDTLRGPVWRFEPLPESTPVDSVSVPAVAWFSGYGQGLGFTSRFVAVCMDSLQTGPAPTGAPYDNGLRFDFKAFGPSLRLAGLAFDLRPEPQYHVDDGTYASRLDAAANGWSVCVSATPPIELPRDLGLISTMEVAPGNRVRFASTDLAVRVEAGARARATQYYKVFTNRRLIYQTFPAPSMRLYFYRPPAATSPAGETR